MHIFNINITIFQLYFYFDAFPQKEKTKRHVSLEEKREKKAAKTLAIVTGAFIVCWLPFFVMAVVSPLCNDCINDHVFSFFLWLGYFNSTLNPIIYTGKAHFIHNYNF